MDPEQPECGLARISRDRWASGHRVHRADRDDVLLLWIEAGRLTVSIASELHQVGAGTLVWICPGRPHRMAAAVTTRVVALYLTGAAAHRSVAERLGALAGVHLAVDQDRVARAIQHLMDTLLPGGAHLQRIATHQLAALLWILAADRERLPGSVPAAERRFREAKALIDQEPQRFADVAAVAAACGITRTHLARLFKEHHGTSPLRYLRQAQLDRARQALVDSDLPVSAIAELCGFDDPLVFSKRFRRAFGCAPQHLRDRARSGRTSNGRTGA